LAETLSLLEFVRALFKDADLREGFSNNPERTLDEYGLSNLSLADVYDACVLVEDNVTAEYDRNGGNHVHYPPPSKEDDGNDDDGNDGNDDHEAAVEYLNRYITNIDDRDTEVDNSLHQEINTAGGGFAQDVDVDSQVVSGDEAVGAGGDITDATLVNGDENTAGNETTVVGPGNVVGDRNEAVTGDRDNTAFGQGDAETGDISGDVQVDTGDGIATAGEGTVDSADSSIVESPNTESAYTSDADNSLYNVGNGQSESSESTDNSLYNVGNYEVDA
jgi:hypothetical protein